MKRKLVITKDGLVWIWQVREGRKNIAGGFCKTKKDATNDGGVWMRRNDKLTDRGANNP